MATRQPERNKEGITRITVGGFKSINQEQSIEVRPLTILAGANSSGKSSIMQPLLLLKQTLEANYDPGALLLNGPNVKFTSVEQLLSRAGDDGATDMFHVGIEVDKNVKVTTSFVRSKRLGRLGFAINETIYEANGEVHRIHVDMSEEEFQKAVSAAVEESNSFSFAQLAEITEREGWLGELIESQCFLVPVLGPKPSMKPELNNEDSLVIQYALTMPGETTVRNYIRQTIHLPGLRGNPERTYPVTAVGSTFSGTFENYVASVVGQWQVESNNSKLEKINRDLFKLGLTSTVAAKAVNDTQVEILVNRFPYHSKSGSMGMVNIADVGLGVSQVLPVVVALHAANQGQLVYLEQPEIHLHPRAQTAMAEVLADAVLEGKRMVVETHSSLLLLGIQTLVAEGKLPKEMVKLHWFTQQEDGSTRIDSADLDETGAFGDWPEDFDTVSLDAESRYIDAAHNRLKGN